MDHAKIIESVGKTGELAELFGVPSQIVSKWKVRGVPWRLRAKFAKIAKKRRVKLPSGFLGE